MTPITGPCPQCGAVATREPYDIGSGPELSCAACEWCWGAAGQDLDPLRPVTVPASLWDAVEAAAEIRGETVADVIRRGLEDYLRAAP